MSNVIILHGNEPYCIDYRKNRIIEGIDMPEINVLYSDTFDDPEAEFLYTTSLFGKKLAVISVSEFKGKYLPKLSEYLKHPSVSADLLIVADNLDQKDCLLKEVSGYPFVTIKKCDKVTKEDDLDKVLLSEIKNIDLAISESAYTEFKRRMNYFECDSVNLYNMTNALKNIRAVSAKADVELIKRLIPENGQENIFSLAKLLLSQKHTEVRKQVNLICEAGKAMASMAMVLREFRIAWKLHYFSQTDIGIKYSVFRGIDKDVLLSCMNVMQKSMDSVKCGAMNDRTALTFSLEQVSEILQSGTNVLQSDNS